MKSISPAKWFAAAALGAIASSTVFGLAPSNMLLSTTHWLAISMGGFIGILWFLIMNHSRQIKDLEQRLNDLIDTDAVEHVISPKIGDEDSPDQSAVRVPDLINSVQAVAASAESIPTEVPVSVRKPSENVASTSSSASLFNDPTSAPSASARLFERLAAVNLPVKIGVLMLFVGLAALLRYAADQGWLGMPIELRLTGISLLGIAGLHIGWKQRDRRRVFALSIQGGAIGVLVLTVFAAFRLYILIPQSMALLLAAVLITGGGALAWVQRTQALALFVMIAGFSAPILLAGNQSNPVALFSWYAILNVTTCVVAIKHYWPLLTRLGFFSTFVIGTLWGVLSWRNEYYWTAQGFLILFFLLYFLVPIVQARVGQSINRFDVLLIFGLPLFAFPLQIALLSNTRLGIAFSALAAAAVYLLGARWLFNRSYSELIAQSYAVLSVGLATLAVPFAFSGPTVVMIWALEGSALIWFGCLSDRRLSRIAGLSLIGIATLVWIANGLISYNLDSRFMLNASGLGGLSIAVGIWLAAWQYNQAGARSNRYNLLFSVGFVIWLFNGLIEINRVFIGSEVHLALVVFSAISLAIFGLILWRFSWFSAALSCIVMLGLSMASVFVNLGANDTIGLIAWVAWLFMVMTIVSLDRLFAQVHSQWQIWINLVGHAAVLTFLSKAIWIIIVNAGLAKGWIWLSVAAPLLLLNAFLLYRHRPPLSWYLIDKHQRLLFVRVFMSTLISLFAISLLSSGDS
ncbi:MAG: DUF2339 domain-containing protein, partial [Pseudomonadota bacterium]